MPEFIIEQRKIREDYKEKPINNQRNIFRYTIWNKTGKNFLFLLLFAIIVPILIYYIIYDINIDNNTEYHTCAVNKTYKIQCGNNNATESYCQHINCCFDNTTNLCYHYLPSKYYYHTNDNNDSYIPSLSTTPFGNKNFEEIALTVNEIDENRLTIILQQQKTDQKPSILELKNYFYQIYPENGAIEIYRNTNEILLTTAKGPLIISQNYWEWSFQLSEDYLFGLGETLIELNENTTLTKVIYNNINDHSSLPIFLAANQSKFHGLIVRHDGPLEITVLPSKLVSLKSLSGDRIELELSVGPTVKQVLEQQRKLTDLQLPNQWILGTHLCRGGSLVELDKILDTFENVSSIYESDCIHENLLLAILINEDSSLVARLQNITAKLVETRKLVLSVPPQIPEGSSLYKRTTNLGIYYKNKNGTDYIGKYLNLRVVYPYYQHSNISDFLTLLLETIRENLGFLPTNLVFNNNFPTDDNYRMNNDQQFPYLSSYLINAMSNTIPWNILANNHQHILEHNNYGSLQLEMIENTIKTHTNQTIFTMTASHNLATESRPVLIQTSNTTWSDFRSTIKQLLFNSLFVTPFISAPVCGSTEHYNAKLNESLCIRWYLMAATMPLLRFSSDQPQRDPDSLDSGYAMNLAKSVINKRNLLKSHYLTTIFNNGGLWIRPMFYDFENDTKTYTLYSQYMIGDQILIAHPTLPDAKRLRIYLPSTYRIWYEFWGGNSYDTTNSSEILFDIVESDWISFVPEGKIIHLIDEQSDSNNVKLIIALQCNDSNECQASGNWLIGSILLKLEATQDLIKINGLDDGIREEIGCNIKPLIVDELHYYKPNLSTFKSINVDLCVEDGYIMFETIF